MSKQKYITVMRNGLVALTAFLATSFTLVMLTSAQQQPAPNQQALTSKDVNDADLKKFAAAFEAVADIRMDLKKSLAAVQDPSAAQQLQQEAQAKILEAVQGNDLEVPQYNALARGVNADKELFDRFQEIQKQREEERKKEEQQ